MVLDTSLLNIQYYKVRIKGKLEQSRERSSALPYTSVLLLLNRESSGCPRLQLPTYIYIYIYRERERERLGEKRQNDRCVLVCAKKLLKQLFLNSSLFSIIDYSLKKKRKIYSIFKIDNEAIFF